MADGHTATVFLKTSSGKASEIAALLEKDIVDKVYAAGQCLPAERALAERFGVSRNTIREAIGLLAQRRLVVTKWGAGTVVLEPEETVVHISQALGQVTHELDNVAELRALIEPGIAALAAGRATQADLLTLNNIIERTNVNMQPKESANIDMSYHMAIARCTGNPLIVAVLEFANDATEQVRVMSHNTHAKRQRSLEGHARIFERLRVRDVEGARMAMERHLREIALISTPDSFPTTHELGQP